MDVVVAGWLVWPLRSHQRGLQEASRSQDLQKSAKIRLWIWKFFDLFCKNAKNTFFKFLQTYFCILVKCGLVVASEQHKRRDRSSVFSVR